MIQLQGYNTVEEKYVTLVITDEGVVLGEESWNHIRSGSVKRFTEKCDTAGNLLYEDDDIISVINGLKMTIRYGEYEAFCPEDQCSMANIGFYVEAEGYSDMPLGPTEEYARLVTKNT